MKFRRLLLLCTLGIAIAGMGVPGYPSFIVQSPLPPFDVRNFGAKFNARRVTDGVTTIATTTVDSATAAFTAADVGRRVWAWTSGVECLASTTVATFVSATRITTTAAAAATCVNAELTLGTDDTTSIQNAAAAALAASGTMYFPAGNAVIRAQVFNASAGGQSINVRGEGLTTTALWPAPDYDFSTTGIFRSSNVNYINFANFAVDFGAFVTYTAANARVFSLAAGQHAFDHVRIFRMISAGATPDCVFFTGTNGFRAYRLHVDACSRGVNVAASSLGTFYNSYLANSTTYNLSVSGGGFVDSYSTHFDESGTNSIEILSASIVRVFGGFVDSGANADAVDVSGAGSMFECYACDLGPFGANTPVTALRIGAGAFAQASGSTLTAAGAGNTINNAGTFTDLGGNTLTGGAGTTGAGTFVGGAYLFSLQAPQYSTTTNCASAGGTCGSAAAGAVSIAAAATTVTVSTTAVKAASRISVFENSTLGTELSVTCNTSIVRTYSVTTVTAGTSFVITASAAPVANPACLTYWIVN